MPQSDGRGVEAPASGSGGYGDYGRRIPQAPQPEPRRAPASRTDSIGTSIAKTAARTVTNVVVREAAKAVFSGRNSLGGQILRGVLGSILR